MDCTLETCPVSASIYGYRPSIPANAFFVALFGTTFIVQFIQGVRYRRIMLHDDPFGQPGFNLQICTLTLAPAFLAAAVYLMLKHLVLATSPSLSRFPARYYTYIFITCDLISLVLQAAGGGTAATSDGNMSQLDIGDHMMMAGLVFQVFTLVIFGAMSLDFAFRSWQATLTGDLNSLCSLAVIVLTVMHPGYSFNYRIINNDELRIEKQRRTNKKAEKDSEKDPADHTKIILDSSDGSEAELGRR
ncbi:putative sphingoid long-chain base transporter rsb1 [Diplodia seriata]|uniref:Putative sphingoid long-chain base transporter rsb1 n=1 Tax=Diplodia seriata TaxID=420778 RepID=A0A0G2E1B7_9PEZI|nr:putative sphingoid long-chain base transporter rsb1 [Diplodia seriata]